MMMYENIRLVPADNGLIVKWTVKTEGPKMSDTSYEDHKLVFKTGEDDQALAKVMDLNRENLEYHKKHSSHENSSHKPMTGY